MKAKILWVTLVFVMVCLITASSLTVFANEVRIRLDGEYVDISPAPVVVDGRILVAAGAFAEMLGAEVNWDEAARQVTISHGGTTILLTVGSNTALVNERNIRLLVQAVIINDITFVPLRFVAENLLVDVDFIDGAVEITTICYCGMKTYYHEGARRPTPPLNIHQLREFSLVYGLWEAADPAADAEFLSAFENVHEFTYLQFDTDLYSTIALWADEPLFNFSFVSLDAAGHYFDEDSRLVINTREVLFTIDKLLPADVVILNVAFSHYMLPHGGVIFTDSDGVQSRMFILESMVGVGCPRDKLFHLIIPHPRFTVWECAVSPLTRHGDYRSNSQAFSVWAGAGLRAS